MMAYGLLLLVAIAGLLLGLIVGLTRRHGIAWTFVDMLIAAIAAVAFILFWLYGLGAIPGVVQTIDRIGRQYPMIGGAISIVTLLTPLVGAAIGLWLTSRMRRSRAQYAA
jgi:hypothetical protein